MFIFVLSQVNDDRLVLVRYGDNSTCVTEQLPLYFYTHMHTHTHSHTHAHAHTHTYSNTHAHLNTHTHTLTQTHILTHSRTREQTNKQTKLSLPRTKVISSSQHHKQYLFVLTAEGALKQL